MSTPIQPINFGGGMQSFGRDVMKEVIKTDYGPGCSFDGIYGHGPKDHGGHGVHDQLNLYTQGVKGSGLTIRFLDK